MKKFFGVVFLVLVVGFGIRFLRHKWPFERKAKKPAVTQTTNQADEMPVAHDESPPPSPTPSPQDNPPPPPIEAPPPPRIAGSTQVSDDEVQHFAAAPGMLYYCRSGSLVAQPKSGGAAEPIGECDGAFDFTADAQGVFYCNDKQLLRVTAGTTGTHVVADNVECIMMALDGKYAYFVIPGFEGVENPGVYRVARSGGTPEKIFGKNPKEQFSLAVDDEALWIGSWGAGTITKLPKTPGAKATTIITGQKGIVDLGVDSKSVYWYSEQTTEVRRRAKAGGPIEAIGHDVDQEPILVVDNHAYWFEGKAGEDKRLMHLAPGTPKPEQLAEGLKTPSMRADSEGVYVSELDREGIFMFKR